MPAHHAVQELGHLADALDHLVAADGYTPRPPLNAAFGRLVQLAGARPRDDNDPGLLPVDLLNRLHHHSIFGEIALEKQAVDRLLAAPAPSAADDLDGWLYRHYPYRWAGGMISGQHRLLTRLGVASQAALTIMGPSGLPFTALAHVLRFKRRIDLFDPDPVRVAATSALLERFAAAGLIPRDAIRCVAQPASQLVLLIGFEPGWRETAFSMLADHKGLLLMTEPHGPTGLLYPATNAALLAGYRPVKTLRDRRFKSGRVDKQIIFGTKRQHFWLDTRAYRRTQA